MYVTVQLVDFDVKSELFTSWAGLFRERLLLQRDNRSHVADLSLLLAECTAIDEAHDNLNKDGSAHRLGQEVQ